jgi:hypothetical protein
VRVARINCRRLHLSLTGGLHHTEAAGRTRTRDHCGAATERPWWPITSAPTLPTMRAVTLPEKVRPPRTTAATIVGI